MDIQQLSYNGIQFGLGVAVIPAVVTSFIACSRILLVNIIANIVVRILTANTVSVTLHGYSLVSVPLLWKISRITALAGGSIAAVSAIAMGIDAIYRKYKQHKRALPQN